jgi:hypothetical protein
MAVRHFLGASFWRGLRLVLERSPETDVYPNFCKAALFLLQPSTYPCPPALRRKSAQKPRPALGGGASCCDRGWDYRLRLKSNLVARLGATRTTTGALALSGGHYFENIILTGKRITTNLGIESSPAFVRAPEGNGCAERFIRTLKENLLWVRSFDTVKQLRHALIEFREVYNTTWLIERHGFRPPAAIRAEQLPPAAKAA